MAKAQAIMLHSIIWEAASIAERILGTQEDCRVCSSSHILRCLLQAFRMDWSLLHAFSNASLGSLMRPSTPVRMPSAKLSYWRPTQPFATLDQDVAASAQHRVGSCQRPRQQFRGQFDATSHIQLLHCGFRRLPLAEPLPKSDQIYLRYGPVMRM